MVGRSAAVTDPALANGNPCHADYRACRSHSDRGVPGGNQGFARAPDMASLRLPSVVKAKPSDRSTRGMVGRSVRGAADQYA